VSSDENEIEELYLQGKRWISEQKGERDMFLEQVRNQEEKEAVAVLSGKVENSQRVGTYSQNQRHQDECR
jgi:hypothetical protein